MIPNAPSPDPVRPADAEALALARSLLSLDHAALAWTDPDTGTRSCLGSGGNWTVA